MHTVCVAAVAMRVGRGQASTVGKGHAGDLERRAMGHGSLHVTAYRVSRERGGGDWCGGGSVARRRVPSGFAGAYGEDIVEAQHLNLALPDKTILYLLKATHMRRVSL